MMFWTLVAVCWACAWCFDHNRPAMGIGIGILFGVFYLINHAISAREVRYGETYQYDDECDDEYEDDYDDGFDGE